MNKKRTLTLAGILLASFGACFVSYAVVLDPMVAAAISTCSEGFSNFAGVKGESELAVPPVQSGFGARVGFIDRSGKTVIAPQFEQTSSFQDGMCAVRLNKRWGFIK